MATADLITQLKKDFDDVYAAGKAAGKAAGGGSGDYEQGYEDGKNSVADYAKCAEAIEFASLNFFGKSNVELNLDNVTTLINLCNVNKIANTNNIVEHITINIPKETATAIVSASSMLSCTYSCRDTVLKKITINFSTEYIQNLNSLFGCLTAVEEIDGIPLDFSSATTIVNPFNYHYSLKEVRFVETSIPLSISFSYSSQLSTETIQSIIDGLADLTGGTAQTLTLHATVGEKLTDEQKATITAKNWELVY